jgi:hypothetical protein
MIWTLFRMKLSLPKNFHQTWSFSNLSTLETLQTLRSVFLVGNILTHKIIFLKVVKKNLKIKFLRWKFRRLMRTHLWMMLIRQIFNKLPIILTPLNNHCRWIFPPSFYLSHFSFLNQFPIRMQVPLEVVSWSHLPPRMYSPSPIHL